MQFEQLARIEREAGRVPANDTPVFDTANTAKHIDPPIELGAVIPAGKAAEREWLANVTAGATITHCKYRPPRGPAKWKPKKRRAANDNNSDPLPIVEALRRDGRESDIPWIMRYRMLCEVVGTSAFDDTVDMKSQGIGIEARSLHLSGKAFEKSFGGMTETSLPGGEISYREQRHTVKQVVSVGQRTLVATDETTSRGQVPMKLYKSEDQIIARLDGRPVLAALRAGMGDLVHFFEDAVLGQWDLTKIGDSLGYKWKERSREAKILIYTAIDRLRDQWRMIDRQMAASAAACERLAEWRRNEIAAERTVYFGLAA